jgi:RHS repeat-associated protein
VGRREGLNWNESEWDCTINNIDYTTTADYDFQYQMPDGSAYRLANLHYDTVPNDGHKCTTLSPVNVGYSESGGIKLDSSTHPYTAQLKDGSRNSNPEGVKLFDTNGNFILLPSPGLNANADTLGRTVSYTDQPPLPQTWTFTDSNGATQQIIEQPAGGANSTTQFPSTSCGAPIGQYTGTMGGTNTLTMPDGRAYVLTFDPNFAEVIKITLPTGGYIRYQYTTLAAFDQSPGFAQCSPPAGIDSRRVSARFVSPDGNPQHEQQWQYAYAYNNQPYPNSAYTTTVTDPLGNVTVHTFNTLGIDQRTHETMTQYYDNASHPLRTVANTWSYNYGAVASYPWGKNTSTRTTSADVDWQIIATTTTLADTNQVKETDTTYDNLTNPPCSSSCTPSVGNVLSQSEYDWGSSAHGPLLRRTVYTYLSDNNSNYANQHIDNRVASRTIYDSTNNTCQGQAQACAQATFGYDTTTIATKAGVVQHDYTDYPSTMTYRGNPTTISRWRNTDGAWLTTTNYYNELGNLTQTSDPLSHSTYFDYTDSWSGTACIPSGGTANAFVTKTTNALGQFATAKYFPCSSLTASTTDLNSLTTSFAFDAIDRLTQQTFPDGGQKTNCYSDISGGSCYSSSLPLQAVTTVKITSSQNLIGTTVVDGLGRVSQTQLTSGPLGTVSTDTTYDGLGRTYTVSNPHVSGSSPTDGITTYVYDAFSRTCVVVPPDGTAVSGGTCPATQPSNDVFTSYSGNTTTATDQAGKSRKSLSDGLGRLTQVFEDPSGLNYETDYTFDALDNLLTVNQKGGQTDSNKWRTRTFTYNSLSQLLTASNPESGTITYAYNSDGTLATKIAPAPNQTGTATATTTFAYDQLHRVTQKSFSDTTPTVKYGFDAVAPSGCTLPTLTINNGIGRRTGMCDAAGAEAWSYDITANVGWKITDARTTNSVPKSTVVQNNLTGSVATLTYPSGRIITYSFDAAAHPVSAVDSTGPINYATAATYTPPGGLSSFTNGASIVSTLSYNDRLQPCRISVKSSGTAPAACTDTATGNVVDFSYNFSLGVSDNGNVMGITNNRDTTRSQLFTYDSLNRILVGETTSTFATSPLHCWGEQFAYDPWGNLSAITGASSAYTGCSQEALSVTPANNNQISGFCYDSAGNLLAQSAPPCPVPTYTYNAENQMTLTAGVTYTYDGDGKRVQKSGGKLYWYGMGSDPLDETDLTGSITNAGFKEYIFFGSKRIARRDSTSAVNYYFSDHLGTARIVANSSGTVLDDSDFYPFGGERVITSSSGNAYKFTGKERDTESGLDNFGARYDASSMGRFMSPDTGTFQLGDPRSLNRFTYVLDNPLRFFDPDGKAPLDSTTVLMIKNYDAYGRIAIWADAARKGQAMPGMPKDFIKNTNDPTLGYRIGFSDSAVEEYGAGLLRAAEVQINSEITAKVQDWLTNPSTTTDDLKNALISFEGISSGNDIPHPFDFIVPDWINKGLWGVSRFSSQGELIWQLQLSIEQEIKRREEAEKKKKEEEDREKKCKAEGRTDC